MVGEREESTGGEQTKIVWISKKTYSFAFNIGFHQNSRYRALLEQVQYFSLPQACE